MEIDVYSVDKKIRERWNDAQTRLTQLETEYSLLDDLLDHNDQVSIGVRHDLVEKKRRIECEKEEIQQSLRNQHFYTMEASELLESHHQLPKKISFMAKVTKSTDDAFVKAYLDILKKYNIECDSLEDIPQRQERRMCRNCQSIDIITNPDQNLEICENCGKQEEKSYKSMSFKDITRINLSNKYTYERRIHFKDCMNQYQGKQNSTIAEKVYSDLEEQFERHGLLKADPSKKVRFQNVTKEHILLFLKETGHTKHYEDIVLIYHKMTGKPVNNISHLESVLMEDFDKISSLYDKNYKFTGKIDRKSFINTQYVLFQLLRRHKYNCKKEDFNMLKTLDRKSFHDEIVRDLFESIGFNFTPIF